MILPNYTLQTGNFTIEHYLVRPGRENTFDLNAPYQRGSVWTVEQRRLFINSILCGFPIPGVFVAELPYGGEFSYRVIDGKQRIETIRMFANNELTVPSAWFDPKQLSSDNEYVTFDECQGHPEIRRFRNKQLPSHEFDPSRSFDHETRTWIETTDPAEHLRIEADLYMRLNNGGTPHTDADLEVAAKISKK